MTAPDPSAILRAYHEAIERLDFTAIEGFFAPDAVYVSGGVGGAIAGRDAIMTAFRAYFAEYGDQVSTDESVETLSPDTARAVWRLTATSSRTGRRLDRNGHEIVEIDAAGMIVRVEVTDR